MSGLRNTTTATGLGRFLLKVRLRIVPLVVRTRSMFGDWILSELTNNAQKIRFETLFATASFIAKTCLNR